MPHDATRLRRQIHIGSGIVLAAFITCHFVNHAFGLVSVSAMEHVRNALNVVWRSLAGTLLLYSALAVHFLLALHALYNRKTLRMPAREMLKIGLGLSLPFFLVTHVIGTRVELALSGFEVGYPQVLQHMWLYPGTAIRQSIALVIAWVHGCLGIWFWLRGRSWFPRYQLVLFSIALIVPVLALLGFALGVRDAAGPMPANSWFMSGRTDPATLLRLTRITYGILILSIGGVLVARLLPRRGSVRISYPDGRFVQAEPGSSVLEASRMAGIPHVAVCGGRGRCSTCRVRILEGADALPAASDAEAATLARIRAPANVRLACQLRPTSDLTVSPVLEAETHSFNGQAGTPATGGRERRIAVLFCDLREFTRLAEHKLPFDTVFLLNSYFEMVGLAVERAGGTIDKFIGDGALALFGLDTTFEEACAQALSASIEIARGIEGLNTTFAGELERPLRIAMGLHAGAAIVGTLGYGRATGLTAVGDTINTASRLETVAKQNNAQLAVSDRVVTHAGATMHGQERQAIAIRGRDAMLDTWIVRDTRTLHGLLPKSAQTSA